MPRMTVYLDEDAYHFVKEKTPGYVRRLVREKMARPSFTVPANPYPRTPAYEEAASEPFEEPA